MELFINIRHKIGDSILSNKLSRTKRELFYSSISQVKNIGIVWDATRTEDFNSLSRFYLRMAEKKTEVTILGYYPEKVMPNQYMAQRYLSIIKKDELDMFYHPVSAESTKFLNNQFDVLIDMNFRRVLPLKYISSLSKAHLKVGLFEAENKQPIFDLMMDLKNPVNIDDYLHQVLYYLEMIHSGQIN
jgi:hypothetical protein